MTGRGRLDEYRRRRDFDSSAEPAGKATSGPGHRFVIQHHAASSDHYDFRLEVDGVLKSWAVPKGPSTDPRDKRLAMPTEDHPLEYAGFEGVIPAGEYGGGTVMVWDDGEYENTSHRDGEPVPLAEALDRGHATFVLHGQKLTGGYALNRMRRDGRESWLLVKERDSDADARRKPVRSQPRSVSTGRTMNQIRTDGT
jgi:DNA ligase D-like protein (predicted 3'-phosphoesterase)